MAFPQVTNVNGGRVNLSTSSYGLNNLWGAGSAVGSQSLTATSPTAWSTTWNWVPANPTRYDVQSYVAAIKGWHWGWYIPSEQTGLPIGFDREVRAKARWTMNASGVWNVTYDLWCHPPGNIVEATRYEIMIWTAWGPRATISPIFPSLAQVVLAGHTWRLITTPVGYGYMIEEPDLTLVDFDVNLFARDLVSRGLLPSTHVLTSVQFGTEVFTGAGTLAVTDYDVIPGGVVIPPTGSPITLRDYYRGQAIAGVAVGNYSVLARAGIRGRADVWADEMIASGGS